MAIKFAAEFMQGYNNPNIEIINIEMNPSTGEALTTITYDDIKKILARGVFPIVSLWGEYQGNKMRFILPLSATGIDEIVFAAFNHRSQILFYYGITFTADAPPSIYTSRLGVPSQ